MIRLGAAPISWGICEMPGWGRMLPAERVLAEMNEVGIGATELGAPGFLPDDEAELARLLARHELSLTGGFVPVVIHDPGVAEATIAEAIEVARGFQARGATYFVAAAVVDPAWSPRFRVSDEQMAHMGRMLGRIQEAVAPFGVTVVLHPHVNTLVETAEDVDRIFAASDCLWCLDTGHLAIGGTDVVEFTKRAMSRIGLVHLKDVDLQLAKRYLAGERSWMEIVQDGIFSPIGQGDVPMAEVIELLENAGYDGWYVLEQDVAITGELPPAGTGPIDGVRQSVDYLRSRFEVRTSV